MNAAADMIADDEIAISWLKSKHDSSPRRDALTWQELADVLAKPRKARCTIADCAHADCAHKNGPSWSPATFPTGAARKQKLVESVSMLVVDLDHLTDDGFAAAKLQLEPYKRIIHPSHSDRDGDRCVRVLVATSRPVTGNEWPVFWPAAMSMLGQPADPACCDSNRLYYLPSRPRDADYWCESLDGNTLDVDAIIASAKQTTIGQTSTIATSLTIDDTGTVGPGQRHAMLKSLAGAMRFRGATQPEIEDALASANRNRCNPPKPDAEIKDLASWAAAQPVTTLARSLEIGTKSEPILRGTNPEPRKGEWAIEPASSDWVTEPLPPREHLLVDARTGRGAMDKAGVWLFGGAGGAGKSYATIALGLSVVSGRSWFRTFKAAGLGRALIVAAEDPRDDIRRRVYTVAKGEDIPASDVARLHVLSIHDRVTSLVAKIGDVHAPSADTKSLCSELASRDPYDLVIVDPYGRIAGVSVDADNAAAAATITALAMIGSSARGLVLGVTHTSLRARIAAQNGAAEGATGIRGATGQADYARGVIRLEKDKNAIWLSLAKANHVAQWEPIGLRRGDHGELTPIDAAEIATLTTSQSSDGKAAKREAERAKRDDLDDAAAREAIAANPGLAFRKLRAIVMKARTCGKDRADDALHRCPQ